jgi:putative cell wall-binding protein
VPLEASPVSGSLDATANPDDVYSIALEPGDGLTVSVTAAAGTDYDLYLFWPDATSVYDFELAAAAVTDSYPEVMTFAAPIGGTYFVDVNAWIGSGDYTLTYEIVPAESEGEIVRMWGEDRYGTALDISKTTFDDEPSHDVVLATGQLFPDALTAGGLAGALGCPLLLTRPTSFPPGLVEELARLEAEDVHIVGGPGAVSEGVEQELERLGYVVFRYGGIDRYETAELVALRINELNAERPPDTVFVARGDLFPDALAVGPLSYVRGYPILLTRTEELSAYAARAIERIGIEHVIIAGGPGAVSEAVRDDISLLETTPDTRRIGGPTRYETAKLVADFAVDSSWSDSHYVGIATGQLFPDALTGGVAAGANGGVLVLSLPSELPWATRAYLEEMSGLGVVDVAAIYGGTGAIADGVRRDIEEIVR